MFKHSMMRRGIIGPGAGGLRRAIVRRGVWLGAFAALVTSGAHAASIDAVAARDTFITQNANLGGPNSTHGSDQYLWAGGVPSVDPPYTVSHPLAAFDLSAYRGATVTGNAHFQLWLNGGAAAGNGAARDVGIYAILKSWTEFDAKWDNFGGFPGVDYATDVGPLLSTQSGVVWPGSGDRYITWDVPTAVVQSWIDHPTTNFGLLVRNFASSVDQDLRFSSKGGGSEISPRLTFDVAARAGDFDNDGALEPSDVDLLLKQTPGSVPPGNPVFDVNGDGVIVTQTNVPNSDVDFWVHSLAHTNYGDSDLDGAINFPDLVRLAMNYGQLNASWERANFDNDGVVGFSDLVALAQHYGQTAGNLESLPADFAADWALAQSLVPEPTAALALSVLLFGRRVRRTDDL